MNDGIADNDPTILEMDEKITALEDERARLRGLLREAAPWLWNRIDDVREKGGSPSMILDLARRIDAALSREVGDE